MLNNKLREVIEGFTKYRLNEFKWASTAFEIEVSTKILAAQKVLTNPIMKVMFREGIAVRQNTLSP